MCDTNHITNVRLYVICLDPIYIPFVLGHTLDQWYVMGYSLCHMNVYDFAVHYPYSIKFLQQPEFLKYIFVSYQQHIIIIKV